MFNRFISNQPSPFSYLKGSLANSYLVLATEHNLPVSYLIGCSARGEPPLSLVWYWYLTLMDLRWTGWGGGGGGHHTAIAVDIIHQSRNMEREERETFLTPARVVIRKLVFFAKLFIKLWIPKG
jgi:hypothetical protein